MVLNCSNLLLLLKSSILSRIPPILKTFLPTCLIFVFIVSRFRGCICLADSSISHCLNFTSFLTLLGSALKILFPAFWTLVFKDSRSKDFTFPTKSFISISLNFNSVFIPSSPSIKPLLMSRPIRIITFDGD